MLKYLNNDRNVERSPNENYARELMELFTLGEGNYTEDDIKEVARAFTGWTHDGERFVFRAEQHDDGQKVIFGMTGNFGGDEVVSILARHPACAPYIAGKLYQYFVGDAPSPDVAASLGRVLANARYELRPLLRTILKSRAFFDASVIGSKIKSPVQLLVGLFRAFDVQIPRAIQVNRQLEKLGQVPFAPPNVKGWPGQFDGRRWINTATLLARQNVGVDLARQARIRPTASDPAEVVDHWLAKLLPRPIDDVKRRRLIAAAGSPTTAATTTDAVQLIVSMPEYQLC